MPVGGSGRCRAPHAELNALQVLHGEPTTAYMPCMLTAAKAQCSCLYAKAVCIMFPHYLSIHADDIYTWSTGLG